MGITNKLRQLATQAKTEWEGVRFPPPAAERRAENEAHEAAENTPPTTA